MDPSANQRPARWLRAELPALVSSGTISAENAQAIERYYEGRIRASHRVGFVLLAAVGSILVAAGIVLLIAHNWDDFSRPVRSVIAFLPLFAAQILSAFVLLRRNESKAWRESAAIFNVAAIGAAISLVSQTYQIHGSLADFIFVWMLLSIPLVYLMRTTLGAIAYLTGAVVWLFARDGIPGFDSTYFLLLLLLVIPHFAALYRRDSGSRETAGLAVAIAVAAAFGIGFAPEFTKANLGAVAFAGLFAAVYVCGIEFFPRPASSHLHPLALLGGVAIGVLAIVLTFEEFWRHQDILLWPLDLAVGISIATQLIFPIAASGLAGWSFARRGGMQFSALAMALPVVAAVGLFVTNRCPHPAAALSSCDLAAAVILNVYALGLGVELIARGLRVKSAARTNFGLLVIAALAIARFFDSDFSFVTRAIGFIVIGAGFLLTNLVLFRRRAAV